MDFRWNTWNIHHIAEHDVSRLEAEYVVESASSPYPRYIGDGKFHVIGKTVFGEYLQVIFIYSPPKIT